MYVVNQTLQEHKHNVLGDNAKQRINGTMQPIRTTCTSLVRHIKVITNLLKLKKFVNIVKGEVY